MKVSLKVVATSIFISSGLISTTFFPREVANAQFAGCDPVRGVKFEIYEHSDGGGAILTDSCRGEHPNLSGPCIKTHRFTRNCNPSWNDRASSIRTGGRIAYLYSDSGFRGNCIAVKTASPGNGSFHATKALNLSKVGFEDAVSSIRSVRDDRCRDLTNVRA